MAENNKIPRALYQYGKTGQLLYDGRLFVSISPCVACFHCNPVTGGIEIWQRTNDDCQWKETLLGESGCPCPFGQHLENERSIRRKSAAGMASISPLGALAFPRYIEDSLSLSTGASVYLMLSNWPVAAARRERPSTLRLWREWRDRTAHIPRDRRLDGSW